MTIFTPSKDEIGRRLDKVILDRLPQNHSRTEIQRLIQENGITVNGSPAKPKHKLKERDVVKVEFSPKKVSDQVVPEKIPLNIIYEDESLMVIEKPSGMVTHPAAGNREHTLVNALLGYNGCLAGVGPAGRPGIVHRLDKDTSGLIVVAKDEVSQRNLSAQFKNRTIKKEYLALVKGVIGFDRGLIDVPIGRSVSDRKKMAVTYTEGRSALTRYEVIKRFTGHSLVRLKPETGRTHQLRVHLAHLGHPIVGDGIYGRSEEGRRLCLHAQRLGIFHPVSKKFMEFESELPEDIKQIIKEIS